MSLYFFKLTFFYNQFWTFGEIDKDKQKAWERDSRPMANYGLVLR